MQPRTRPVQCPGLDCSMPMELFIMPRMSDAETEAITICMRLGKAGQMLAKGARQQEEAGEALRIARAEAVRAIVNAAPLLTAEQRRQLRPVLAGTTPAKGTRTDKPAA